MVNYRRASEAALLVAVLAVASAAPIPHDCKDGHVYDQRQNGTENYRLNIDGVVIAVAPAESLLSAVSDIDLSDLFDIENLSAESGFRPKPPSSSDLLLGEEPAVPKPENKPQVQLTPEDKPKPEDKPQEKPQDQEAKPEAPVKKEEKQQKKSVLRKQETAQRLKHRIASIFMPFLRKRRHQ